MWRCWCLVILSVLPDLWGGSDAAARGARIRHGDDPRWAAPDLDDRDWTPVGPEGVPQRTGIFWLRIDVRPPESGEDGYGSAFFEWPRGTPEYPVDSIYASPASTWELYWDGRLLGRNGVVANTADREEPGLLDRLVRVPPELLGPGRHVIAMRISSHHYNFPVTLGTFKLTMENYARRLTREARKPILPLIGSAGAILMAAICSAFYLLSDRRRPLLIGALLGVATAVFYGLIALRWLVDHPYDWHFPRLATITAVMAVIAVLLPWMLVEQFAVPRKWPVFATLGPLVVAAWWSSPIFEVKTLWLCRAMLVVSLGVAGWATWRRRRGARFVLAGVAAGLLLVQTNFRAFLDPSFFLVVGAMVLFPLVSLGLQLQEERRRAREASLVAARLETELLKKNIQPHFLLNTLATIMEVIEREPRAAVSLIDALAAEFRILARVSGEKLIPLAQELDLCRAHLQIMSQRKDARCTLETEGVDEAALVPPALFHTLIENGLTHLRPRQGEQRFTLREERSAGRVRYTLLAEGEPARARARPAAEPVGEGTGLRYLRARLVESFAGDWHLETGPVPGGWRTVIEIAARRPPLGAEAGAARPAPPARPQPA